MTTALAKRNGAESSLVPRSTVAEASSAHSRINIPVNLDNWKDIDPAISSELLWFHQSIIDNDVGYKEAAQALNVSTTTIYRMLKGIYDGNYSNLVRSIRSYRKLLEQRASIQRNEFAENSITKLIFAALDYAIANNSVATIIGESRQ